MAVGREWARGRRGMVLTTSALLVMAACVAEPEEAGTRVAADVAGTTLVIPEAFLLDPLPAPLVGAAGLDDDRGVSLKVPVAEVLPPRVEQVAARGSLILLVLPAAAQVGLDGDDAWAGRGGFVNRRIERDAGTDLYLVYPEGGYPALWAAFSAEPDKTVPLEHQWVANCRRLGAFGAAFCKSARAFGPVRVEVSFSGELIGSIDLMWDGVEKVLEDWQQRAKS